MISALSGSAPALDSADNQETALVRYAHLKREQSLNILEPKRWTIKDTSVNMPSHSTKPHPPLTTCTQTIPTAHGPLLLKATSLCHIACPSNMRRRPTLPPTIGWLHPLTISLANNYFPSRPLESGLTYVSDSEVEDQLQLQSVSLDHSIRGKSALGSVVDICKRALESAMFYLRQSSTKLADTSAATADRRAMCLMNISDSSNKWSSGLTGSWNRDNNPQPKRIRRDGAECQLATKPTTQRHPIR